MKHLLNYRILFILVLFISGIELNAQNKYPFIQISGKGYNSNKGVVVDKDTNFIFTSDANQKTYLTSDTVNSALATVSSDIFAYKVNKKGNYIWKNSFGGIGFEEVTAPILDKDGNVYFNIFSNDSFTTIGNKTYKYNKGFTVLIKLDGKTGNIVWQIPIYRKDVYLRGINLVYDEISNHIYTGISVLSPSYNFGSKVISFPKNPRVGTLLEIDTSGDLFHVEPINCDNFSRIRKLFKTNKDNIILDIYFSGDSMSFYNHAFTKYVQDNSTLLQLNLRTNKVRPILAFKNYVFDFVDVEQDQFGDYYATGNITDSLRWGSRFFYDSLYKYSNPAFKFRGALMVKFDSTKGDLKWVNILFTRDYEAFQYHFALDTAKKLVVFPFNYIGGERMYGQNLKLYNVWCYLYLFDFNNKLKYNYELSGEKGKRVRLYSANILDKQLIIAGHFANPYLETTFDIQNKVKYKSVLADGFTAFINYDITTNIESEESVVEDKLGLSLFPNPSNGIFTVKNNGKKVEGVVLFNSLGQTIIFDIKLNEQSETQLDISKYPSGLYFLKGIGVEIKVIKK